MVQLGMFWFWGILMIVCGAAFTYVDNSDQVYPAAVTFMHVSEQPPAVVAPAKVGCDLADFDRWWASRVSGK
jgi:hypothetical protein